MLVSKKVQIEFAHPDIRAIDAIQDIRKAAEFAGLNLFSRHGVQLQMPMPADGDKVVVEVKIPEDNIEAFSIGNHLRGIAIYLLKYCGGRYDQYVVGKRLLNYTVVRPLQKPSADLIVSERFEAIAAFARLLERTDSQATDYINQILAVLKEANG